MGIYGKKKLIHNKVFSKRYIFIVIIFFSFVFVLSFFAKPQNKPNTTLLTKETPTKLSVISPESDANPWTHISNTPTDTWSKYTNSDYNFSLTYPAKGAIASKACFGLEKGTCEITLGTCGNAIKYDTYQDQSNSASKELLVDNFFGISIITWAGSIVDYYAQNLREYPLTKTAITGSNADEAFEITLEKFPSNYASFVYKKKNTLFMISNLQNPGNVGGCMYKENDTYDYRKYKNWDIKHSIYFN